MTEEEQKNYKYTSPVEHQKRWSFIKDYDWFFVTMNEEPIWWDREDERILRVKRQKLNSIKRWLPEIINEYIHKWYSVEFLPVDQTKPFFRIHAHIYINKTIK